MLKKIVVAAVALALCGGAAQAAEKNTFTKEERVGVATGAVAGAIVGGPIGAAVGLMVGGIVGDNVGQAKRANLRADLLERELLDTRIALAKASERTGDQVFDELAQRLHANILFRTGQSELDAQVVEKLAELGRVLSAHGSMEVQVHGFADPRGDAESNLMLSMLRAEAVRQALIDGGAEPTQIHVAAYGEDLTTAPEGDLEAYAWERRVTLTLRPAAPTAVARAE
jgi:outer membrane protein OmpA-like peptidoglycan-associated protein